MNTHLIPFHQEKILAFEDNNQRLIAVKPICEAFQIDWSSQRSKLKKDVLFNSVMAFKTTTGSDGKKYEMVCLPLEVFPMWLAKIEVRRIKNELAKEKILLYQKEAAKVLFEYFLGGQNEVEMLQIDSAKSIVLLEKHIQLLEQNVVIKKKKRASKPITKDEVDKIKELYKKGFTQNQIAREINRSAALVHYTLRIEWLK